MAKIINSSRIVQQIPLASIDEYDDENYLDKDINNTENTNKILKKNLINYSTNCSTECSFEWNSSQQQQLISPISDELNTPTTSSIANHTILTDNDEFGTDTGFFSSISSSSSSSLLSSKHSSINDFELVNSTNMQLSSNKSSINFLKNNNEEEKLSINNEIDDESDEITILNMIDNFDDLSNDQNNSISTSLEDLVNSFDEKVKNCLKNYNENIDKLAPVQIRSLDEAIQNRPAWWTLTGNYGNILPIDWEKISPDDQSKISSNNDINHNTKLKELINSCLEIDLDRKYSIKNAEQVLKEINDIITGKSMNLNNNNNMDLISQCGSSSHGSRSSSIVSFDNIPIILRSTFYRFSLDKLKTFSLDQLQDLHEDLEGKTQKYSQELINRLAERDELEYEKELKSAFLSLLVKIQKHRKNFQKKYGNNNIDNDNNQQLQRYRKHRYLTTIVPYCKDKKFFNNIQALQTLIKILKAMLDDSPAVPALLTDYILKFICPSDNDEKENSKQDNIRPKLSPNILPKESQNSSSSNISKFLNQTIFSFRSFSKTSDDDYGANKIMGAENLVENYGNDRHRSSIITNA